MAPFAEDDDSKLTFRLPAETAEETAEEIVAALQALRIAREEGSYEEIDRAVQAFFTAETVAESKRTVEALREILLSKAADHLLVLHLASARNSGDREAMRLYEAHRDLLARCRRDGIDAAFGHARRQGPQAYGWTGSTTG